MFKAFQRKLNAWPKVGNRDYASLCRFSDFLNQCKVALAATPDLHTLDDIREIGKLNEKLPFYIQEKWLSRAFEIKCRTKNYSRFHHFAKCLKEISDQVNDPILNCMRNQKGPSKSTTVIALATVKQPATQETVKVDQNARHKECKFCQSNEHYLSCCPKLRDESLSNRLSFIRRERRSYKCLRLGHMIKECSTPHKCETCQGEHPTSLHDHFQSYMPRCEMGTQALTSAQAKTETSAASSTTSIIPVWLSSKNSSREELVYALVDSGSNACFISENAAEKVMSQDFKPSKIKIETIHIGEKSEVITQIYSELKIRSYQGNEYLKLPSTYVVTEVYLQHDSVPTKDLVSRWPHLKHISSKFPSKLDCKPALLIGYNCIKAFIPRETVTGRDTEPFAMRTDLGSSIISKEHHDTFPL